MPPLPPRFEEQVFVEMGRLLKEARVVAGLRQRDLAARAGISLPTLGAMENGKGGRVSLFRWVAAFNSVGMLRTLLDCLSSVEVDPFATFEMAAKKKRRKRVRPPSA